MSCIEVRPLGVECNLQCRYCYQHSQREAGNITQSYDMKQMKDGVERLSVTQPHITLFGGEPLLVPENVLEELFAWGLERFGGNGIQTNGTLINDNHIRMFKKYKVYVGISIDGPSECNDLRWNGSLKRTRAATAKTQAAIERLCKEGVGVGLIVTLHKGNATPEKLPMMHEWFRYLESIGIKGSRLHPLEIQNEDIDKDFMLNEDEAVQAFLSFAKLSTELKSLRFDIVDDIRKLLLGEDSDATCTFAACDPYTTASCHGVEGNGQTTNCGRVNKDGVDFAKSEQAGYERYIALYHTPQKHNGCSGCRFFAMCKGFCPGTAIDGDWRNRTRDCGFCYRLFEWFEAELQTAGYLPLSVSQLRPYVEEALLANWHNGTNYKIRDVMFMLMQVGDAAPALHEFLQVNGISHTLSKGLVSHIDHSNSIDDTIAKIYSGTHEGGLSYARA